MCIRDSPSSIHAFFCCPFPPAPTRTLRSSAQPVSYTHLTLPTNREVYISVVAVFFQAEDGIRDFCLSRGLGDVYKRQPQLYPRVFLLSFSPRPHADSSEFRP